MEVDDKVLLSILNEDPEQGMDLLQDLYAETLRFAAAQRLNDPADVRECVCDTLSDFYLQRERFDTDKGSLRGYLTVIAQNKAIRRYRENQRQWLAILLSRKDTVQVDNWEQTEQLRLALTRLPELDRLVLKLKYYDGYTGREIAETMGLEYEAVKKRLQRALKKLQKLIEDE